MSNPLVLLVSRSASRTQLYREALEQEGLSCLAVLTLKEVPALAAGTPLSGILLDMPVLIKANVSDKLAIEDILKALPSAYLNIAPATDTVRLLIATGTRGAAKSLSEFAELCKAVVPCRVRPKDRFPLHLQSLLAGDAAQEMPEQTVTLNVSSNGCFLISTNPAFQVGQEVQINFIGLEDKTPIIASICWLRRWGSDGHTVPGIGVKFITVSDAQRSEMQALLGPLKPH
jgi:hypothetical protein